MPLPLSRNTTYTPESPVKSFDLNDLQDKAIDLWAGRHGDVSLFLPPHAGDTNDHTKWTLGAGYAEWVGPTGSSVWRLPFPLRQGDRIKSLTSWHQRVTGTFNVYLYVLNMAGGGTATTIGGVEVSSGTAIASTTDPLETPYVVPANTAVWAELTPAGEIGTRFYLTGLVFDHP